MKSKIIFTVLLVLILIQPVLLILRSQDLFFSRTYHSRFNDLKKLYYSSQYMIKKNPAIIPDQTLEAFAAGAFIKGMNPILIVHDQPPLGRYITGLSIIFFDNENTITIFLFFSSLFGIFLVSRQIFKNAAYALLPVLIFANEPLMRLRLIYMPLLESVQLPFIIFSIYFFMRMIGGAKRSGLGQIYKWGIIVSVTLGFIISIRYFVLGGALLLSYLLFFVIKRRYKEALCFISVLPLSLVVLAFSYTRTIVESHSIIKPFSVQKYIFTYQSSKFIEIGTVWDLLFFNRWHTWWGDRSISPDPNWILVWPVSTILAMTLGIGGIFKKIKLSDRELVLFLWVCCYLVMLSVGYSSTRYFLPLLPFLYILAFSFIFRNKKIHGFFSKIK
jgi:hypothetical protein